MLERDGARLEPLPELRDEAEALGRQADSWRLRQGLRRQQEEVGPTRPVEERMSLAPYRGGRGGGAAGRRSSRVAHCSPDGGRGDSHGVGARCAGCADQAPRDCSTNIRSLKDQRQRIIAAGPEGLPHVRPAARRPIPRPCSSCSTARSRRWWPTATSTSNASISSSTSPGELVASRGAAARSRTSSRRQPPSSGRLNAQVQEPVGCGANAKRSTAHRGSCSQSLDPLMANYDSARHQLLLADIRGAGAARARRPSGCTRWATARWPYRGAGGGPARPRQARCLVARLASSSTALDYSEARSRHARRGSARGDARREAELALVRARGESQAAASEGRRRWPAGAPNGRLGSVSGRAGLDLALHQELDRALTDLRTDLNAELRPDLSDLASGFLSD